MLGFMIFQIVAEFLQIPALRQETNSGGIALTLPATACPRAL